MLGGKLSLSLSPPPHKKEEEVEDDDEKLVEKPKEMLNRWLDKGWVDKRSPESHMTKSMFGGYPFQTFCCLKASCFRNFQAVWGKFRFFFFFLILFHYSDIKGFWLSNQITLSTIQASLPQFWDRSVATPNLSLLDIACSWELWIVVIGLREAYTIIRRGNHGVCTWRRKA